MNVSKAIVLLGLTNQSQCDDKSIRNAWKQKLLRIHPDKSNSLAATALTQEINAAKDFLLKQAKHVILAHFDSLDFKEKQAVAAEQEIRAARERARQAAERHDLFKAAHAQRSSTFSAPELQESINHCIQDNLNYEQLRRTRQLRFRHTTTATAKV